MKKILTYLTLTQFTFITFAEQDFTKCLYITRASELETVPCRNKPGILLEKVETLPEDDAEGQPSLIKKLLYKIGILTTPREKNIVWLEKNLATPIAGEDIDRIAMSLALYNVKNPEKQALIREALARIPSSNQNTIDKITRYIAQKKNLFLEEMFDSSLRLFLLPQSKVDKITQQQS